MKKQTLIYFAAGAAAIAAIYLLTKKPATTATPKADPVPPKLTALELSNYNGAVSKMNAWLDSVLPPKPEVVPITPDVAGFVRITKPSEYDILRAKYQNLWMAANKITGVNLQPEYHLPQADLKNLFGKFSETTTAPPDALPLHAQPPSPWQGMPDIKNCWLPLSTAPAIDYSTIWKESTSQPITNNKPTSVLPFIKTPLASRI
jgi:hypothetical protein